MNKVLYFFVAICLLNCTNSPKNPILEDQVNSGLNSLKKTITEDEAIAVLKGFYKAMNIDNLGSDLVYDYATTDFVIYETGDKYDLESFLETIKSHFKKGYISTDWSLYDFKVSIDSNTAHISYSNKGKFTFIEDGITIEENILLLESVYLKYEEGILKLSFLQSDDISRKFIKLNSK